MVGDHIGSSDTKTGRAHRAPGLRYGDRDERLATSRADIQREND